MAKNPKSLTDFYKAHGMRRVLSQFPANWLCGKPFFLDGAIANGAATAVDLTVADAWYGDGQVRAQYAPADAGTGKMNATLHLEAVSYMITDDTFTVLVSSTKEKLWTTGRLSVKAVIGGTPFSFPLDGAIYDKLHGDWAAATSSPATTVGVNIDKARKFVLPSPVRIDLYQDSLTLASEADVALGGAITGKVLLWGCLTPNSEGAGSMAPGRSCGSDMNFDEAAYAQQTVALERIE